MRQKKTKEEISKNYSRIKKKQNKQNKTKGLLVQVCTIRRKDKDKFYLKKKIK